MTPSPATAEPAPITGGCLCGRYRFTAAPDPLWIAHCHCRSCRLATGAPVATFVGFPAAAVRFDPAPPQFASSPPVLRASCDRCGTALSYQATFYPGEIHLYRSTLDRPADFPASRHVLFDEREPDFDIYDDLPRYGSGARTAIAWGAKPAERILFLCTGNSARSILAEGVLNRRGAEMEGRRVLAHSAGSQPAGRVHPEVRALLQASAWRFDAQRSKSWDEFLLAPSFEWVITLCDSAAESCPLFPGRSRRQHWPLPDPASGDASFPDTLQAIEERVDAFLAELGAS